jgi:peptidoglycan/xylan/chitin deacetylase (PgdA/CDA1 family)
MLTLLYHNLLAAPADHLPLAGPQVLVSDFRHQMRYLRRKLLHPSAVHENLLRGLPVRGVLVTFDDGAAGILEAGRILAEMGSAGVAFICPGALGRGLWFYRLADVLSRARAPSITWRGRTVLLRSAADKRAAHDWFCQRLFPYPASARDEAMAEIIDPLDLAPGPTHPALAILDEAGLREAAATGGILFGNHSWSHPDLDRLPLDELAHEVGAARTWLERSGLPHLPWFAFPRGVHSPLVRNVVRPNCTVAFGATADENVEGVLPRVSIYRPDARWTRFTLKTAAEGFLACRLSPLLRKVRGMRTCASSP